MVLMCQQWGPCLLIFIPLFICENSKAVILQKAVIKCEVKVGLEA